MKIILEPEKIILNGENNSYTYASFTDDHGCEIIKHDDSELNAMVTNMIFVPTYTRQFGSNWLIDDIKYRYICPYEGQHAFSAMTYDFATSIVLMDEKTMDEFRKERKLTYKNVKLTILEIDKNKK